MRTLLPWLLVPALAVGLGYVLRAQETGEPRKTGKVLLLKTGLAMEGDIEQVGLQMCVRRGPSEVWIAADKTMRLCPDWVDAYAFMQTFIKADNPNDRVKLARWCHLHRLTAEALEQAKIALDLNPEHGDAKQIVTMLERAMKEPQAKPVVRAVAPTPQRVPEPAPAVDVNAETLIAFTSKVQPILMNTCASCHAGDTGGKFKLERIGESGHKLASQRNLAAVLDYIDVERPTISPLLVKALAPHGREAMAPIKDRSAKPFQAMQQWIVEAIRKNPQLKEYQAAKKPAPIKVQPEEKPSQFSSQGSVLPGAADDVISRPAPRLELSAAKAAPVQETRTSTPANERDWCDAAHFNDWAHPKTNVGQIQVRR